MPAVVRAGAPHALRALSCVLSDGSKCLRNTNAGLHERLFDAVAREDVLVMACGNPCGGTSTRPRRAGPAPSATGT